MLGQILDYTVQTNSGVINGDDGVRYNFPGSEWNANVPPARGMRVDFEVQGADAVAVYQVAGSQAVPGEKNKTVAGLLAIFLGSYGIHKFYLGNNKMGVIYLLCTLVGWILIFIPPLVIWLISLIEGIRYLTATDEEFQRRYVDPLRQ